MDNTVDQDQTIAANNAAPADTTTITEDKTTASEMTMTTTTMMTTTTTYENYVALTEKALQKSRKSLDTRALIQLAYGDDTAHIGGSDMLMGILDGVLDKIAKETVLEEMKRYGTTRKREVKKINDANDGDGVDDDDGEDTTAMRMTPQERFDKIDRAISYVIEWETRRDQIEGLDVKSARDSLNKNLLPEGVSMEDVIAYREHEQRLQARTALQQELQRIEGEISVLEESCAEKQNRIREQLGRVEDVERELEASANVCAMITTWF